MNSNWWRRLEELDLNQKAFIMLPLSGRHILTGPPGSGKTNLLLLRAQHYAGQGEKNVLILTFTNDLADFIRSGIGTKGLISPAQVRTFHSWASEHILTNLGKRLVEKGNNFDDETRNRAVALLKEANAKLPSKKLYSAIFIDEAQDLSTEELAQVLSLSDNVCISGDGKQGIYQRDGLDIGSTLALTPHVLKNHYRIGHKIARVADRLLPPMDPSDSLEATSNYNPKIQGESSANMHECATRDEQFDRLCEFLKVQLVAFKGDTIGIFCPTNEALAEVHSKFAGTEFKDLVALHGRGSQDGGFISDRPIHLLSIHSAKGTEFRAVHVFAAEELKFPLHARQLGYTAITRAKTALNAYRTGDTNKPFENAFAEPKHMDVADLFEEK